MIDMIDFACKQFNLDDIIKCALGLSKADCKVFRFFLGQDQEFTADIIAEKLSLDLSTVQRSLKKLTDKDLLERGQHNFTGGGYQYSYRSRSKSYVRKLIMDIIGGWTQRVEEGLHQL